MYLKPPKGILIERGDNFARGLVGFWAMNEGGGNIVHDLSGNGSHATFAGNMAWGAGVHGRAIDNPGNAGDYAVTSSRSVLKIASGTVSIGFMSTDIGSDYLLDLYIDANNKLYINPRAGGTIVDVYGRSGGSNIFILTKAWTVDDGYWHQIAATFNGSIAAMYIDGVSVDTEVGDERLGWVSDPTLHIGRSGATGSNFGGLTDYIAIWNRALTASEILFLYREMFR